MPSKGAPIVVPEDMAEVFGHYLGRNIFDMLNTVSRNRLLQVPHEALQKCDTNSQLKHVGNVPTRSLRQIC